MMKENHTLPEITLKSVILGVFLSIILASANAYLGLFAGMTVSASIPAAVISMGVLKLFKRSNILENNIVQTSASAGESLAAGVIFTIPALVLMGYWTDFDYFEIAKISGIGGLIGVLFTIPLRRALIVEAELQYPEGVATAEVLKAGDHQGETDDSSKNLMMIFKAALFGGLMKLAQQGFQMWNSAIDFALPFVSKQGGKRSVIGFGSELSPALLAVGYIVGRNIAVLVFAGGLISWIIAIPLYSFFNPIEAGSGYLDAAYDIWNAKIRYMGVGAMVIGGIWSVINLYRPLVNGVKSSLNAYKNRNSGIAVEQHEKDIPINWVIIALIFSVIPVFLIYQNIIHNFFTALLMAVIMLIFGFLFSAVAGYMAGLVGSSNNPISGVTIATILFSSLLLLLIKGTGSLEGAAGAIIIGAVVCCAAAIAGDNMQDLKAGYILGATPWKQQIMQIVGTLSAAIALGLTLDILHSAYTIGSETLPAPQATLMKSVAEGVFQGNLPWNFVITGAVLGVLIIIADLIQKSRGSDFRIPILAVAVGIYLPITLSTPIFIGGMVSHFTRKHRETHPENKQGLLFASGLITGEALMGILVAIPIFISSNKNWWPEISGFSWLGILLFILITAILTKIAKRN
ncbi:MAG: Oligopeptide transporter, OPT family [Marinimicrobia bacterium 46_47]|nr:MAG: Oligopeptide transporter, OPT family [Marinimicrobia bacterium 46_47]KUK93213.1 MAG: Oligopeptide transporter, OPT family [Marinimicrobia bacterium 46_43]